MLGLLAYHVEYQSPIVGDLPSGFAGMVSRRHIPLASFGRTLRILRKPNS